MISFDDKGRSTATPGGHVAPTVSRYHRPLFRITKRIFDIVVSLVLLVLLLPLFALVALVIIVTDGTPVTFRQQRIGLNGKLFYLYKFRSMVRNADEILQSRPELMEEYRKYYKIKDDPRISPVGQFLRSTTLDELPQLFNVLRGEMSLVGPRPIVEPELAKFGDAQEIYLSMKPGCAGLWQCSGRSDTTYEERVAYESLYYRKASPAFDLLILWRTFWAVILRRGAV
ncbi:MAG: sugar transferase [Fimbriimonadaceae bacterium]|nr:sugar transferase [Chthonomonadaceae bacterium]MCO5297324.1 sugar transferase [Fimbriimonadaceae bacterium]